MGKTKTFYLNLLAQVKIFSNEIRWPKPKPKVKKNLASAEGLVNRSFTAPQFPGSFLARVSQQIELYSNQSTSQKPSDTFLGDVNGKWLQFDGPSDLEEMRLQIKEAFLLLCSTKSTP